MTTTNRPEAPQDADAGRLGAAPRPWWRTPVVAGLVLFAAIVGLGAWIVYGMDRTPGMAGGMGGMAADAPRIPPVFGYYDGSDIRFIHTEASDPEIARTLEGMMGSPVPVVPSLAQVPDDARSTVYVFTNGVTPADTPAGPLGFQPDVFDSAPGDQDYTPLREIVLVTWADGAQPRLLAAAEEVADAEAAGDVALEDSNVVVNIPLLTWPGGER